MDIAKLHKTLAKEFKRSPGKSLTLLALVPIAIYFVAPLVIQSDGKKSPTPPTSTASLLTIPGLPTDTAAVSSTVAHDMNWQAIAEWRSQDPYTQPAVFAGEIRNPFQVKVEAPEQPEETEELKPKPLVDPKPDEYVLSKTLVGSRLRLATINRKRYELNELIERTKTETEQGLPPFRLIKIERRSVTLKRDDRGKPHRLDQPKR